MDISPSSELGVCSSVNGELWIWETGTGTNRVTDAIYSNTMMSLLLFLACTGRSRG